MWLCHRKPQVQLSTQRGHSKRLDESGGEQTREPTIVESKNLIRANTSDGWITRCHQSIAKQFKFIFGNFQKYFYDLRGIQSNALQNKCISTELLRNNTNNQMVFAQQAVNPCIWQTEKVHILMKSQLIRYQLSPSSLIPFIICAGTIQLTVEIFMFSPINSDLFYLHKNNTALVGILISSQSL